MIKKLRPVGSSLCLILDKPLLDLYNFGENVEILPVEGGLLIRPTKKEAGDRQSRVAGALKEGNTRYGRALKNLAK